MKKRFFVAAVLAAALSVGSIAAPVSVVPVGIVAEAATKKAELPAPENIAGKVSKDSIVLTWDKVEGADGYRVYMYDTETKKFKKYKTVAGTKCTVKDLEKGKTYYFKVATLTKSGKSYVKKGISSKVTVKMTAKKTTSSSSKPAEKKAVITEWGEAMYPEKHGAALTNFDIEDGCIFYYYYFDDVKDIDKYLSYLESCGCKLVHDKDLEKSDSVDIAINVYDSEGKNVIATIATLENVMVLSV